MWGQWYGQTKTREETTTVVLNLDDGRSGTGRIQFTSVAASGLTSAVGSIVFDGYAAGARAKVAVESIDPWPQEIARPASIDVEIISHSKTELVLNWTGSWAKSGRYTLSDIDDTTVNAPDERIDSWTQYRSWVDALRDTERGLIFRGQAEPWPLQTSFHRERRRDLVGYGKNEVPLLQTAMASSLGEWVMSNEDLKFGAMLHLAQHHGFPTPLLDWTESPYIAAFFAFNDPPIDAKQPYVRVIAFDRAAWQRLQGSYRAGITNPDLFFQVHLFAPLGNPRALPQQSVGTSTNIGSPERFLRLAEKYSRQRFITTVDMPREMRSDAMSDLAYMGISAGSMYPGLDGICRALRERRFRARVL